MAIYKLEKTQYPTGLDYAKLIDGRSKTEKGVKDQLLKLALKYKGPKNSLISFDFGLRHDFNGNPDDELIGIKTIFEEEFLTALNEKDAIKKLDFLWTNSDSGPIWTARIQMRPERLINYFNQLSKKKITYVKKNGYGYVDFHKGEHPQVLIGKEETNQCILLSMFLRALDSEFSLEAVYSELKDKKLKQKEIDKLRIIKNATREILKKLKSSGHGRTIRFVARKPENGRYVCYAMLP